MRSGRRRRTVDEPSPRRLVQFSRLRQAVGPLERDQGFASPRADHAVYAAGVVTKPLEHPLRLAHVLGGRGSGGGRREDEQQAPRERPDAPQRSSDGKVASAGGYIR
jgi:hypothetical protein